MNSTEFAKKTESAGDRIKRFFSVIARNNIAVSYNSRLFAIPIAALIIIAAVFIRHSLLVILISLFCGFEYTLEGEDFTEGTKISFRPQK